jgi:N-acetyl-1-D-myo-inositol-2-amino-2-deoxy-alpha-D-glucopyranoside deacetylase
LGATGWGGWGSGFLAVDSVDDLPFGVPDEQVTTEIDARDYLDAKLAALRAHRSQIAVDSPFFALSDQVGRRAFGQEYYTLLAGPRGPGNGPAGWEDDLFGGLD